jgi:hypothetical protein
MNEAILVGAAIELAKLGLQIWFQASAMSGMTEAQKAQAFHDVQMAFLAKDPANLPTV